MSQSPAVVGSTASEILARLSRWPLWVYCLIAALFYALSEIRADPYALTTTLGDSDDALRLASLREFMANGGWFDRTFDRLGGDNPLISHWSRVIDLVLGTLMAVFGLVMSAENAELVTRALWPTMVLVGLMLAFARHSTLRDGRVAGLIVIGLVMYASAVTVQFNPGRVDHHNVMIASAGAGILFLVEASAVPRMGFIAGALLGLGTAVGFEALTLTAAALAIAGLFAAWTGKGLEGVTNAALSFLGTLVALFVLTVPPSAWGVVHCDELSINLIILSGAGAAGLAAVTWTSRDWSGGGRFALIAFAGTLGLIGYAMAEPQCLQGPFAQADRAIRPIWLEHVQEGNHILETIVAMPQIAFIFSLTSVLGLSAAYLQWHRRRDECSLLMGVLLALAIVLTMWQVKFVPYASLLALPMLAGEIARLEATEQMTALTRRLLAFFLANQHSMLAIATISAGVLGGMAGSTDSNIAANARDASKKKDACYATQNMKELDQLPAGRFAGHIDLGPFIVANTHHQALAGPYHRLDKAIIATHAIGASLPLEAEQRMRQEGVTYFIDCIELKALPKTPKQGLVPQLKAGNVPAYLETVPLLAGNPLRVWRLKSGA